MQLTYILGVIESFETEARSAEDQRRAAYTSGCDSSLEKCLPVASRFFVVRSPCQEDEAILPTELRFRQEKLNESNKICFTDANTDSMYT